MDFSQNYCVVTKYDGVSDVLRKAGTVPRGSLVKVEGSQLKVFQGQGEVIVDAPTSEVHVRPPRKATPSVASIDVGENHWLIDFGRVHKATQRNKGGIGAKIAAASAFGNFKAIKVGKELRGHFVASLESQGAQVD